MHEGELTATLFSLATPHPDGHWHSRHDHLGHGHTFPHSIREQGHTVRRAEHAFHMLYVLRVLVSAGLGLTATL